VHSFKWSGRNAFSPCRWTPPIGRKMPTEESDGSSEEARISEQKAEAVKLAEEAGNISKVARSLDIHPNVLGKWVKQARIDAGSGPKDALTTEEKKEIQRLKRDLKRVRMERDFLKKAAAFFAREESSKPSRPATAKPRPSSRKRPAVSSAKTSTSSGIRSPLSGTQTSRLETRSVSR